VKMRQEIEAEIKKKFDTQRRKFEQEKKKFEKVHSKFVKEKKDVNMMKTQLDAQKRVFTQSMRKNRNKDFNPIDMMKDIEQKISVFVEKKAQANQEWDKIKAFRKSEEAEINEQRNKMKIEQASIAELFTKFEKDKGQLETLMQQHDVDLEYIKKRSEDLEEAEKAINEMVGNLQMREEKLQDEEGQMSRNWEEFHRSQSKLREKQLKNDEWESDLLKKKNDYDIIHLKQQSKERELKHLEEEIKLNMQDLQKDRESWDKEQKQIYFDNMFAEKRAQLKLEMQKIEDEKASVEEMSSKQSQMSRDLQVKMESMENTKKQFESMKLELDEQLHKIDKQRQENAIEKQEILKSREELFQTSSLHQDIERQLKIQEDQMKLEYQKLRETLEEKVREDRQTLEVKVREELAAERAELNKKRKNLENEISRQKALKTKTIRDQLALKKKRVENDQEIERRKSEFEQMKIEAKKTREYFKEEKIKFEKQKILACKELESLEIDRKQLLADRERVRESVEKEVLDKYNTMMSLAQEQTNTIAQEREAVAAEKKKLRQEKLDVEEQRENLELQIKQRVKSRVAEQEKDLTRKEIELTRRSTEVKKEWERIQEEDLSTERSKREVLKLKSDAEELSKEANEKLLEAAEQMKAVSVEKRKLEDKHRKVESKLKELTRKEELYSEKQEYFENERFRFESQAGQISEVSLKKNPEIAKLESKVTSLEKSNRVLHSQLEQIRKELHESKENFLCYHNLNKKSSSEIRLVPSALGDDEGCPIASGPASPSVGQIQDNNRDYWIDDKLGENLPSIPTKAVPSPLKSSSTSKRERTAIARHELLSRYWDDQRRNYKCGSIDSASNLDNTSYVYSGFYRPWKPAGAFLAHFSKARPPVRKQPGQVPSLVGSDDSDMQERPSKFFINMIESGEHLTTIIFFLGSERKVVKAIKGIIMDASPKLKELLEAGDSVELPDLTSEGFEAMLNFIYSRECTWSRESLVATMACASKFGLDRLYRTCFEWLEINVQQEDALKVLDDCMTHAEVLGESAKHAIEKAAWDIIISDGSGNKALLSKIFSSHTSRWVKNVVKGNSLVCSEEVMFDAVANWATELANIKFPDNKSIYPKDWRVTVDEEKCSPDKLTTKAEVVKNILPMVPFIRFPVMSINYITSNGLIGALLKPLEILEVLRWKHDSNSCNLRFKSVERYQIVEISQEGCCAQSSEHYATLDYDPKLAKFDTGEGNYPSRISGNMLGKVLGAELALTRCVSDNDIIVEGPAGLDVAQTKLDFQPWWDLDLGRLCRIQRIRVLLGVPGRIPGQTEKDSCTTEQSMFPIALCLGRDSFPAMEGTLTNAMQMSVKTKIFENAPAGNLVELQWEPALVAARTFRIQCAKATLLRIMNVQIFAAEPIMNSLPCPVVEQT